MALNPTRTEHMFKTRRKSYPIPEENVMFMGDVIIPYLGARSMKTVMCRDYWRRWMWS